MEKRTLLKRIGTLLMCLCILFAMLSVCAQGASVYTRPRKNVYLVMDDSGSMQGLEHEANYAMQTLVAMMDKTDTINLYFLNAGEKVYGNLDLSKKSNAMLDNIKVNYPQSSGGTPYDVVTTAQADLKKAVDANSEDEYWLVVITDGDFAGKDRSQHEQDMLNFAKTPLKNGDLPNVMCIGIGLESLIRPENATADNVYTEDCDDVISSMNAVAAAISGRIVVKNPSFSSNGTKLSFKVPYPARNIIIFAQNTQTTISSHTSSSKLNTSELYTVAMPIPTADLDKSTVCFITEANGGSIAPGEVSFTFSKAISESNTVVMVEPAIGLVAHFYNQDGECDPSKLKVGETAKLVYTICDPSTQKEIDDSIIAGGVTYSADINGKHYDGNTIEFTVDKETLELDMYAKFSDGFVLDIHDKYEDLFENRIIALNLSTAAYSADINSKDDSNFITASPSYDGIKFVDDEFKACSLEVKGIENPFKLNVDIKSDPATGTYTIYPQKGWLGVFTPVQQEIELVFKTDKGEEVTEGISIELTGDRNWAGIIIFIIVTLLLLYCIIVYVFFKPKFPLDLCLRLYYDKGEGIDVRHPDAKKTLFSWGVINLKSLSPVPPTLPIKLNVGRVFKMGNLVIEATKDGSQNRNKAHVKNVKETSIRDEDDFFEEESIRIDFKTMDKEGYSERGFPDDTKVLHLKDGEYISEQEHHATDSSPKRLRYVRRKTLKDRGEL